MHTIFHSFCSVISHITPIILGILGFSFLIGFHELGHFLCAKLFNVATPSFSIGFGPRLITKKIGDTEFALSAIPFGGYVEIAGMLEMGQGDQKQSDRRDHRSFAVKPYYQKAIILLGGIAFNLIFSYTILIVLFWTGMPASRLLPAYSGNTTIAEVLKESPADRVGIHAGDKIVAIADVPVSSVEHAFILLNEHANQEISVTVIREGSPKAFTVQLNPSSQRPLLGATFTFHDIKPRPFKQAIRAGINATHRMILNTVRMIVSMISHRTTDGLGGPITVIMQSIQGAKDGCIALLIFLAVLSVSLAVFNLIPLPVLDGGQLLIVTLETIVGHPLPTTARYAIYGVTWVLLVGLMLFLGFGEILAIIRR